VVLDGGWSLIRGSVLNSEKYFCRQPGLIDKNCIFIAGKSWRIRQNNPGINRFGCIRRNHQAGSFSHIGIGTVIQGHGGVQAGDYFTSSAGCRIYSFSNDYRESRAGMMATGSSVPAISWGLFILEKMSG
jgi:hypothetical protein